MKKSKFVIFPYPFSYNLFPGRLLCSAPLNQTTVQISQIAIRRDMQVIEASGTVVIEEQSKMMIKTKPLHTMEAAAVLSENYCYV